MDNKERYQLAANAVRRKKYDDAVRYFMEILEDDPEYVDARKGLRLLQNKMFNGKKLSARMAAIPLKMKVQKARKKEEFADALIACEEYLCKDPTDLNFLQLIAEISVEAEYKNTAVFAYETMAEVAYDDPDVVLEAAEYLSEKEVGMFDKANEIMEKVVKANPDDTDLKSEQSRINARKVTVKFEEAENSSDLIANKEEAKELEDEAQDIKTEDDLQRAIERAKKRCIDEEGNTRHHETLGELLFRAGDLKNAKANFEESVSCDENNLQAKSRLGDVVITMYEKQINKLKKKAAASKGEEQLTYKKKAKAGIKQLFQTKTKEYQRRINVNPNDLKTRYDLGVMFFQRKEYDKAIAQFQKSVSDANLSFKSSQYLGFSFKEKRLYDMAIKEFLAASKKANASLTDRLGVQNDAGDCYLELNQVDKALEIFKEILEKDYAFKDVAKKVEQLSS